MSGLKALAVALTTFSRLPAPRVEWNDGNLRYALAALPLLGLLCGALLYGWLLLCQLWQAGALLYGAGLTLLPLLLGGGLHLDGFADVADALASHAAPERKREILKDPHCGAFAVIAVGMYLLAYVALASELEQTAAAALRLAAIHVLSRVLMAVMALYFPSFSSDGLLHTFRRAAARRGVTLLLSLSGAAALALLLYLGWLTALAIAAAAGAALLHVRLMARRHFGGVNGDVCGYFLQMAELLMLLAMLIAQKML
ncbi:MAG: adenosylcobinamide-GDP ribazoletransferase [Bacillota bacterium]|nr:adenosylcobinamide-GDP ribazoletransferase [Bacillota bacterium]